MTTLDLDHLSKLAEAATPGPWSYEPGGGHAYNRIVCSDEHAFQSNGWLHNIGNISNRSYTDRICENLGDTSLPQPAANAAYIAALDPATVQELIRLARLGMERLAETTPTGREYIGKYATQTMLQEATKRAAKEG